MRTSLLALLLATVSLASACSQNRSTAAVPNGPDVPARTVAKVDAKYPAPQPMTGKPGEFPVQKTEAEWKKRLTSEQFYILREKGTERAFNNPYWENHKKGSYYCAADHNLLFTSETKFESGTGWPSFWAPASDKSLKVTTDDSYGMSRDELVCAKCGGHLGHVFDDGPKPTGMRYCMDSYGMTFEAAK